VPLANTIKKPLKGLLHQARKEKLSGQLARGLIGSIGIKIVGTLLGLSVTIVLARSLGPMDYGIFTYAISFISILAPTKWSLASEPLFSQINQVLMKVISSTFS